MNRLPLEQEVAFFLLVAVIVAAFVAYVEYTKRR